MKNILKQSQLLCVKTFDWEIKLKIKSIYNPLYIPLGFIIGKINDLQMKIHSHLIYLNYKINKNKIT